jgi:hypothetical protein
MSPPRARRRWASACARTCVYRCASAEESSSASASSCAVTDSAGSDVAQRGSRGAARVASYSLISTGPIGAARDTLLESCALRFQRSADAWDLRRNHDRFFSSLPSSLVKNAEEACARAPSRRAARRRAAGCHPLLVTAGRRPDRPSPAPRSHCCSWASAPRGERIGATPGRGPAPGPWPGPRPGAPAFASAGAAGCARAATGSGTRTSTCADRCAGTGRRGVGGGSRPPCSRRARVSRFLSLHAYCARRSDVILFILYYRGPLT